MIGRAGRRTQNHRDQVELDIIKRALISNNNKHWAKKQALGVDSTTLRQ